MELTSKLTAIANAIRSKSGSTSKLSLDGMVTEINKLKTTFTTQSKTATPTKSTQTIKCDSGYDGLSQVSINPIPNEYIIPSGSETKTQNGTYDVTSLSELVVNVSGGGSSDFVVLSKEVTYSSKSTSGAKTLFSQQELVNGGVIPSTSSMIKDVWEHYRLELTGKNGSFTHSTKQIVQAVGMSDPLMQTSSQANYGRTTYHNTSATSASVTSKTSACETSATGHLYLSTSGMTITPSSTYGLGVGTYIVAVMCWGKK